MVGVNHSGSQEDGVSSWEPAHSLVEDAISGAEIVAAPCLQACLCFWAGRGQFAAAGWVPFAIHSIFCSVKGLGCTLGC